ncbi:class I SAM-dependent methyltransferase [Streptomyces sp. NPDC001276]|uniref:class I SAM-dependent methyltransferase n=1 Tax=Streptomyces sp. NPDC001276 TaxID=3364555 RepID=UPI0036A97CF9
MKSHGVDTADTGVREPEQPGLLIPWARRYNLLVTVIFGGRRGALNNTLVAASGVRPGDRVLDVGCGPGVFAGRLAEAVGPGGRVVGVDPSAPMVEYATRHAGRSANCRFVLAAAQHLDLPDGEFDVVTSTFAMHHIPEGHRKTALAQMYRVLRPGGRLLIADAFPSGPVAPRVTRAIAGMMVHGVAHGEVTEDPMSAADVRQYADALRAVGFTEPRFADVRPWTRYLLTERPATA